jgi:hypothetical protein
MRVVGCGERAECGGATRDWRRPLRAGGGLPNGSPRLSVMFNDDWRGAEAAWATCVDETGVAVVMGLSERRRFVEKPPM